MKSTGAEREKGGQTEMQNLFGFLTSSSTTRLYRGRVPRLTSGNLTRRSGETMTSVSAGQIILTPTQPVGSGRPQRESNPRPSHQESRALSTELPRPPRYREIIMQTDAGSEIEIKRGRETQKIDR